MSGGSLDYVSYRFKDAAVKMLEWIRERTEPKSKTEPRERSEMDLLWGTAEDLEYDWTPDEYYQRENPDVPYLKTAEALKAKTKECMETAAQYMLAAAKMCHEAEWMMSDDTGPETFCMECEKILAQFKAGGWPEERPEEVEP